MLSICLPHQFSRWHEHSRTGVSEGGLAPSSVPVGMLVRRSLDSSNLAMFSLLLNLQTKKKQTLKTWSVGTSTLSSLTDAINSRKRNDYLSYAPPIRHCLFLRRSSSISKLCIQRGPEFDHLSPAVYLLEHESDFSDVKELQDALNRFEKLFDGVNALCHL